jgi:ABC-type transport system involved in multi-copper enzyme maturation permease subunit
MARLIGIRVPTAHVLAGAAFMIVSAFGFYGLSTFLTTLFDEFWTGIIGMACIGGVFGLEMALKSDGKDFTPGTFLSGAQFNHGGTIAWPAIAAIVLAGAGFMAASIFILERKEY